MSLEFKFNLKKPSFPEAPPQVRNGHGLFLEGDNGAAVILVHGLTGTPQEMRFLASYLNKRGYTVSCPLLANHGEHLEVLKATKWQDFYQSVRNAFMEVKDRRAVFAAGLSMGALLVLLLAEEFPQQVSGVSCISPTLFYDGWNMPWYRCFLPLACSTPIRHFLYFKEDYPYGIKNEAIRERVHRYYTQVRLQDHDAQKVMQYGYPFFPVTLLRELKFLVDHLSNKLAVIHTPTQIIQAVDDDMTSVKNAQFIYDRIRSLKKEIVLLENSYHVITADQEREKAAQKLFEFFDSIYQGKIQKNISYASVS
ncbi:MAG: alpha/beta fold hydrolase [Candidatus Omnitrophica bacterium]|nr:alpha/beta fold hydrolase [Candidatus Omnitrophota bacterium]